MRQTLQVMDRTVAFDDLLFRKPRPLELSIHVAGIDEATQRHGLEPVFQQAETGVRHGGPIEIQAMPVEAPGQLRITAKNSW